MIAASIWFLGLFSHSVFAANIPAQLLPTHGQVGRQFLTTLGEPNAQISDFTALFASKAAHWNCRTNLPASNTFEEALLHLRSNSDRLKTYVETHELSPAQETIDIEISGDISAKLFHLAESYPLTPTGKRALRSLHAYYRDRAQPQIAEIVALIVADWESPLNERALKNAPHDYRLSLQKLYLSRPEQFFRLLRLLPARYFARFLLSDSFCTLGLFEEANLSHKWPTLLEDPSLIGNSWAGFISKRFASIIIKELHSKEEPFVQAALEELLKIIYSYKNRFPNPFTAALYEEFLTALVPALDALLIAESSKVRDLCLKVIFVMDNFAWHFVHYKNLLSVLDDPITSNQHVAITILEAIRPPSEWILPTLRRSYLSEANENIKRRKALLLLRYGLREVSQENILAMANHSEVDQEQLFKRILEGGRAGVALVKEIFKSKKDANPSVPDFSQVMNVLVTTGAYNDWLPLVEEYFPTNMALAYSLGSCGEAGLETWKRLILHNTKTNQILYLMHVLSVYWAQWAPYLVPNFDTFFKIYLKPFFRSSEDSIHNRLYTSMISLYLSDKTLALPFIQSFIRVAKTSSDIPIVSNAIQAIYWVYLRHKAPLTEIDRKFLEPLLEALLSGLRNARLTNSIQSNLSAIERETGQEFTLETLTPALFKVASENGLYNRFDVPTPGILLKYLYQNPALQNSILFLMQLCKEVPQEMREEVVAAWGSTDVDTHTAAKRLAAYLPRDLQRDFLERFGHSITQSTVEVLASLPEVPKEYEERLLEHVTLTHCSDRVAPALTRLFGKTTSDRIETILLDCLGTYYQPIPFDITELLADLWGEEAPKKLLDLLKDERLSVQIAVTRSLAKRQLFPEVVFPLLTDKATQNFIYNIGYLAHYRTDLLQSAIPFLLDLSFAGRPELTKHLLQPFYPEILPEVVARFDTAEIETLPFLTLHFIGEVLAGHTEWSDHFVKKLQSSNLAKKRAALIILSHIKDPASLPEVIQCLTQHRQIFSEFALFSSFPSQILWENLIEQFRVSSKESKLMLLEGMKTLPNVTEQAREFLLEIAENDHLSMKVRQLAIENLTLHPNLSQSHLEQLLPLLEDPSLDLEAKWPLTQRALNRTPWR